MMRVTLAMALLVTAFNASAGAQEVDCENANSNVEMTHCGWQAFERADEELNAVYQEAIQHIRASGNDLPAGADQWEAKLREAQRAWVAFRDLNCDELLGIEWGGGTGTSLAIATCRTEMTEARTEMLRQRYLSQ